MGQLEELIDRCTEALDIGVNDLRIPIVGDYVLAYEKQVEKLTGKTIDRRKLAATGDIDLGTIRSIRTMLIALKEHRDHELAVANAGAVQASMSMSQTVTTTVTYTQTLSGMWGIPDSVMDEQRKEALAALLRELDESKGQGPSKIRKAAKAVGDWLFDKGMEAIPTVMPYVVQTLQGIL